MPFLRGNGMCLMMDFMPMHSLPIPIACGGTGASTILGDGVRPGITTVGMVLVIGMVAIGVAGLIIITIIIGIRDITIIRTLHGVV